MGHLREHYFFLVCCGHSVSFTVQFQRPYIMFLGFMQNERWRNCTYKVRSFRQKTLHDATFMKQ